MKAKKQNISGLRTTHFDQLMAYLEEREKEMWYYGPKDQFEKRHKELREWIIAQLKEQ